jgi:hypothetical protein
MARPKQFITKDGNLNNFKTVSANNFSQFQYGDIITGSDYPYSSNIIRYYVYSNDYRNYIKSLKNTLDYYTNISQHYTYSSSYGNKEEQEISLISIPSIFYGSSIRKGSITCKWYVTGTLIAELSDINQNGELIQVGPSGSLGSGSVAGVALYKEGFILLTGSWSLHPTYTDRFGIDSSFYEPSWKYFMNTGSSEINRTPSSSFNLEFEGVNYIPTITMLAHAKQGEFNHSNNPTYISKEATNFTASTGSISYLENDRLQIKNMVSASYTEEEPQFIKTTYISKIAIYDEEKNLIGIAKLANPVRKRELDSYTFKLKMDF